MNIKTPFELLELDKKEVIKRNEYISQVPVTLSLKEKYISALIGKYNMGAQGAALATVFVALLNLTFINGIDGMNIMCELLGVKDLPERAKTIRINTPERASP